MLIHDPKPLEAISENLGKGLEGRPVEHNVSTCAIDKKKLDIFLFAVMAW
jgi:hypothetical protein